MWLKLTLYYSLRSFMIYKNGILKGNEFNEIKQNFNIIGNPIISNKILYDTSKNNYVSFNINSSSNITFQIGFKYKTVSQAYNGLISKESPGFQFYTKKDTDSLIMELFSNTPIITFTDLVDDRDYILSFSYSNSTFTATLYSSVDSVSKTYSGVDFDMSGTWRLGITQSGNYGYDGFIYMDKILITSNGKSYAPAISTSVSSYQITCEEFYEI